MSKKRVRLTSEELLNRKNAAVDFTSGKELIDYPKSELMSIVTAFRAYKNHGPSELTKHYPLYEDIVLKYQEMDLAAFIDMVKGLTIDE